MKRVSSGLIADLWSIAMSAVICHRLLFGSGYGLGRDMVFTPRQPLTWDAVGLGSTAPRAVPVDGLVALLTHVVDGTWVGRFAVFGVLVLAGCGAHRVVPTWRAPVRTAVAGLAVWNPFVIERLALGQWSLLAAYAALPWLVVAIDRYAAKPGLRQLAGVIGWLALASITPTGGVVALAAAVVLGARRAGAVRLIGVAAALQLPWLLPSVLGSAGGTSDPAGIAAFAARSERPGGPLLSLLGLGGIWDAGSTPSSRGGALGYVTTVVFAVALVLGWPLLRRALDGTAVRLVVLAGAGLLIAVTSSVPGGRTLLKWAVEDVPGAGLLRDSQKWLLPFALLCVLCVGAAVQRLMSAARLEAVLVLGVIGIAAPLLLLPDAIAAVDRTLTPSAYPRDFTAAARVLDGHGPVATIPFESYRRFTWSHGGTVADPASRWFDTQVITSDELVVGDTRLSGESPLVGRIAAGLRAGRPASQVLAANGVRWALVYLDAGSATPQDGGLVEVYAGRYLAVYRVAGPIRGSAGAAPATGTAWTVATVDLLALLVALSAALVSASARIRDRRTPADCYAPDTAGRSEAG